MINKPSELLWGEIIDFLLTEPNLEQLAEFQASESFQERVRYLLDKAENTRLTDDEQHEMDTIGEISHVMTMLKARARLKMRESKVTRDAVQP